MSGGDTVQDGIERLLLDRLARIRKPHAGRLEATTPFNECGVDSIEAAGIAVDLEAELGLVIDPVDLLAYPTPRDLARYLAGRRKEA